MEQDEAGHTMTPRRATMYQRIVSAILRVAMDDITLNEILRHALDAVLRHDSSNLFHKGAILLVADDADYLVLCAHAGFSESELEQCRRIPIGSCCCGQAAMSGTMQYSGPTHQCPDGLSQQGMPQGLYCVPICAGEEMLGVLALYLRHGHTRDRDEKEMLWAISNILASVVKRKKAEVALQRLVREQEAMITRLSDEQRMTESIIRSLRGGLMVCNRESTILKLNPAGRMILRRFLADPASDGNHALAELPLVRAMLEHGGQASPTQHEIRCQDRTGMERTVQYTVRPLENSLAEQIGLILQFDDITEMVRIGQAMKKMNKLSTMAELASAVAHEVRNPLAGIKTMSQAIEENCGHHDENREYIRRIIKQVDRLNGLLNEFFTYATPGRAKREQVSLGRVVAEIRHLVLGKTERKGIELVEEYEEGLPDIHVDPNQLQQVLLNLMLNAIDAIEGNGRILIHARRAGQEILQRYGGSMPGLKRNAQYVLVLFRDNGVGMEPEVAERAFEPFFTTKHQGTGLGLAIVQRILDENNAFIALDDLPEQGVGFVMLFESAARDAPTGRASADNGHGKRSEC